MDAEPRVPVAQERRGFRLALILSAVIVAAVVGGLVVMNRSSPAGRAGVAKLPFGPSEREYSTRIQLGGLEMSRAANFLNQEVTYLSGTVVNPGDRSVREIQVTIEFRDTLNQVVLRETRYVLGPRAAPLGPAQSRSFQSSFDHVPADWNMQLPAVRVTGLAFE